MTIDIDKLGVFKNYNGGGDDIVNLQSEAGLSRLTTNGKYHQFNIFRGIRSQAEVEANRKVRETLLQNLREAFSLQADDDYMNKLRQWLGNDILKSEDFGVDAQGHVHTNCPLTERRISAIVKRVRELNEPSMLVPVLMTKKCVNEFVSGVKQGKFGTANALTDFFARHFAGDVGRRLKTAMQNTTDGDRGVLLRERVAAELLKALRPALVEGGVTRSQLQTVMDAIKTFSTQKDNWSAEMALLLLTELTPKADDIASESLNSRLENQRAKLEGVTRSEIEKQGSFAKLMKSDHGRDILVRTAIDGMEKLVGLLPSPNNPVRQKLDKLTLDIAGQVKRLGTERANIFVNAVCKMSSDKNGPGLLHMQQRQLLGTVLKQYTNLADADLKQFSLAQLQDYARAAVDDSLMSDRETILNEMKRFAESMRSQNYTDVETRELIEFAHEQKVFKPVQAGGAESAAVAPANPKPPVGSDVAMAENKIVCDNLTLLGKLFHREDVWTTDALGGAEAILDTLKQNADLVNSLKDNWARKEDKKSMDLGTMNMVSSAVTLALNAMLGVEVAKDGNVYKRYSSAIADINKAIVGYAQAENDDARRRYCQTIADRVEDLMTGLSLKLQGMLTQNLDTVLAGAGMGAAFKDLPPGRDPETADLLELAKSHHPTPKHETAAQRKEREAAILTEYSQLVVSPQAGGLGTLIRSLATNYVGNLDNREKRAMLSGALQAVTPELLTKMLKGKSVFGIANGIVHKKISNFINFFGGSGEKPVDAEKSGGDDEYDLSDLGKLIGVGNDGSLPEAVKAMAGAVVGGLLKGSGPVLQKMVQMIGAEKLPPYLRQAVKECKSDLKPIPTKYVEAKLAEIVRQSNGEIVMLSNQQSIGAASIAQAFKCDLTDRSGKTRTVVLKMMRPDVRGRMEREIAAIRKSVAGAGEGALRSLNARIDSLLGELDFTEERSNIEQCQSIYGESSYSCLHSVKLAAGCPQLPDVMVMELAPGRTFQKYMDETTDNLDKLLDGKIKTDKNGRYQFSTMSQEARQQLETSLMTMYRDVYKRQANLQRLMQTWFSNAVFGNGKFHGDLHGGNVMVDENGQLTVIDFGNAPTFSDADRKSVVKLVVSAARGEARGVLAAVSKLVSTESRQSLTANFAALQERLDAAFAIGGLAEVGERLTIAFGELARAGVEVPAALYNFVEAFGRVQQLSDSMIKTLDRISSAIPFVRDHLPGGGLAVKVDYSKMKSLGYGCGKSMDQIIDEYLMKQINQIRTDEPFITDAKILKWLQKSSANGLFDNVFASYSMENPIVTEVMDYGSSILDPLYMEKEVLTDHLVPEREDYEKYLRYKNGEENSSQFKEVHDYVQDLTKKYVAEAQKRIETWFGPFCQNNSKLLTSLKNLKALVTRRLSPEYLFWHPWARCDFDHEVTHTMLDEFATDPDKATSVEQYIQDTLYNKLNPVGGRTEEDIKRDVAEITIGIRKILCTEIFPAVVDRFKSRMREVVGQFDLDRFPPPVSIMSSLKSSLLWHIPTAIGFGGTDAIGLFAKTVWKSLTDKEVAIRANFKVPLDTYRDFASGTTGRIHMTENKVLESVPSLKKLTVHNAEAWRALAESLMADMKLAESNFYRSTTWKKIAAIFEFGDGENFINVEKAGELTPTALQRILAVRDMDRLDRSQPSLQLITSYFADQTAVEDTTYETAVEDTTYEQFNARLTSAFADEFGVSVAEKLGMEPEKLDAYCKMNYGKIIARMTELGAADPYSLATGKPLRPQDLRRWLIAATLETLRDAPFVKNRDKVTLEAVFGQQVEPLKRRITDNERIPTSGKASVMKAILLHVNDDDIDKMLTFCNEGHQNVLVPRQKIRYDHSSKQTERDTSSKNALHANFDGERKEVVKAAADALGFGMAAIANDQALYRRYVALQRGTGSNNEDSNTKLLTDLSDRVRKSIYFLGTGEALDELTELEKILGLWEKKYQGEQEVAQEEAMRQKKEDSEDSSDVGLLRNLFSLVKGQLFS